MALPLPPEPLGDWLHLTLLDGEDVLFQLKQIKAAHRDKKSGGTAIYVDKAPMIVQQTLEEVHAMIVADECGGTNRR